MSFESIVRKARKALPVILANAPAVIAAGKAVAKAVKKHPKNSASA